MKKFHLICEYSIPETDKVYDAIKLEQSVQNRSELFIKKEKNGIVFESSAQDYVALKATTNTVLKIVETCEKTRNLKNG